jgi:hypothetical protein
MLIQILTTFIQLYALDLYNREEQSFKSRFKYIEKSYFQSLTVRIVGFTIAYGIGGIVNTEVKRALMV